MSIKTSIAIGSCKAIHSGMRMLGRTARSLPGKVALKIDPSLIRKLAKGHKSIVITGTNGKTTTTHIVQQAIIDMCGSAAYDPSSTNLSQGIATTLCLDSSLSGKRKNDWAVIECDEGATKRILPAMKPDVLIVTNLYRDQVDRFSSWTTARDYIIEAIKSSPDTKVVLNADCQVTASIADEIDNDIYWFGVNCNPYSNPLIADYDKEVNCIKCGTALNFEQRTFAHLGNFSCPNCGFAHARAHILCTDVKPVNDISCKMTLQIGAKSTTIDANIRAGYDVYNAMAAIAGLTQCSVDEQVIVNALAHFKHAAHRFELFDCDGSETRLLLMKNTAGCNQLINMIVSEGTLPKHVVCLLGAEIMDGLSTEWIQDVRWEKLITPETQIIVGGPKYEDIQQCLLKAGAQQANMRIQTDYAGLVKDIIAIQDKVCVIANCSTIEALRLELVKKYKPIDYWSSKK